MYKNMIAVTNRHLCQGDFLDQIQYLASTEVEAIILREKDMSQDEYRYLAKSVLEICHRYDKKCILHSFIQVARELNCPYIHLPLPLLLQYTQNNLSLPAQSDTYFPNKSCPLNGLDMLNSSPNSTNTIPQSLDFFTEIGTSVHSLEDVCLACDAGSTYLTAGHIFDTDCKKGLPGRGLNFLRTVCSTASVPVYAIGGITPENLTQVMDAGAVGGCIMSMAMKRSHGDET